MAKRTAVSELTHNNWDEEETPEEAGVFQQAAGTVLKQRQIRKAKRRGADNAESDEGPFKAFSGFAGFGNTKADTPAASFNFGTLASKPANDSLGSKGSNTLVSASENSSEGVLTNGASTEKQASGDKVKYLHQLKCLNESVTKWIKDHVDKNPYCILTPIFKDYEKHLGEIEKKFPNHSASDEKQTGAGKTPTTNGHGIAANTADGTKVTSSAPSCAGFKFGLQSNDKSDGSEPTTVLGSAFAVKKTDSVAPGIKSDPAPSFSFSSVSKDSKTSTSGFSFGSASTAAASKPADTPSIGGFKFGSGSTGSSGSSSFGGFNFNSSAMGSGTGFSFGASKLGEKSAAPSADNAAADGEDEYVPPKPEVNQVQEEDAFYSKRCKLYFQKEGAWTEKGVGNLHLKKCDDKNQLLIRADTNLGNILLNIMLSKSLPLARQGKNNVSLMCIPNPPLDPKMDSSKPANLLIRVKGAEDADELFEKLQESQQ